MLNQAEIATTHKILTCWDKLTDAQKNLIISSATLFHYQNGDTLHCAQTDCIGMLLIKSGTVRVYILSDQGKEVTLYRLYPGDVCVLSAACVLKTITFDVHIDAETNCDVIQLSSALFAQLSTENVYFENFAYKLITQRFSDVMWTMQQILFLSLDQRLATFLLKESEKNNSLSINLTHEQIAKYIGSAREVISRMLKYFAKEGLVSLSRGGIEILQKEKLLQLKI